MAFGDYSEEMIAARGKGEIQKNEFYLYSKKKWNGKKEKYHESKSVF